MKNSDQQLEQLSIEQKRILIAQMLQKKRNKTKSFPLSMGQERIWLHTQLNPDNPLYNAAVAYNLKGSLNVTALEHSLQEIIKRHQTLRTIFSIVEEKPVQVISSDLSYTLSVIDLQNIPESLRQDKAKNLLIEAAKTPFNLSQGPLWCIKLLRCSQERHILLVIMHHIISDGWSFYIFCQELKELYEAFCKGETSPLPDLPIQYVDFAQRQRDWLSDKVSENQMAYWKMHLEGKVPSLELPVNRPQANIPSSYLGTYQSFQLSPSLSQALKTLSKQESATLFMILIASFQVLLHKYSGQQDLVLCSPVASRHRSQTKKLIGYFNNILPIRTDLSGNPSFLELISRVRQVALNAYKNQDVPFQTIIDLPNLIQTSLTRVLFSVDLKWPPKLSLSDISSEAQSIHTERVNFDISVSIWEELEQLKGVLEYKTDLFDDSIITQMLNDYQNLLEDLVNDPQQTLSSVPCYSQLADEFSVNSQNVEEQTSYLPPRSVLELQVTQIWEQVLGISPIGVHDNLFVLGASSLSAARLCERIQKTFNNKLSLATIFQAPTVEQVTKLLRTSSPSLPTSSLAAIQPNGDKPPLFLCEGVGIYSHLIPYLGLNQPIYGLMRETSADNCPRSIEDIATYYLKEIHKVQSQGPYFLGGISFGGLVAFEMAQQLYAKGEEVALVALFDTPTLGAYKQKPIHLQMFGHVSNLFKFGFPYIQKKTGKIMKKFQRNFTPGSQSSSEIIRNQLFRQMAYASAKEYQHKVYPGSLTLFTLSQRAAMTDSIFDPALGYIDPFLGWGAVATGGVEVYQFPGEHTTILREPHVKLLGEQLKVCLEKAQANSSLLPC